MFEFQLGQEVICVDTSIVPPASSAPKELVLGRIYTIRWIGIWKRQHGGGEEVCVRVEDIHRYRRLPYGSHGFATYDIPFLALRFRPLKKNTTNIDVFTEILNATKISEDA
jgi:hypothetical protein